MPRAVARLTRNVAAFKIFGWRAYHSVVLGTLKNSRWVGLGWIVGVMGLVGCAAKPVVPPQPLASEAARYEVAHDGKKSLSFGDYKVVDIKRSWKSGVSLGSGGVAGGTQKQKFSFAMYVGDELTKTSCEKKASSVSVGAITADDGEQVLCDIDPATDGPEWKIVLARRGGTQVTGRLVRSGEEIAIAGDRPASLTKPRAYTLNSGVDIAAVDVGPKSEIVWIGNGLDAETSHAIAATATALMVYDDLR